MEFEELGPKEKKIRRDFVTGARFDGVTSRTGRIINGYGVYTYPNGDEFCGFFKEGKFHGYGRMKRSGQKKFTLVGTWEHGQLKNIDDMTFHDGLNCKGELKNDMTLDTKNWTYCQKEDRRFFMESNYGRHTTPPYAPTLGPDNYDAGQGVFIASSGFMVQQQYPLPESAFISCPDYREWIVTHARRGLTKEQQQQGPDNRSRREILEANLEENSISQNVHYRICKTVAKAKATAERLRINEKDEPVCVAHIEEEPQHSPAPSYRCNQYCPSESCPSVETPALLIHKREDVQAKVQHKVHKESTDKSIIKRKSDVVFLLPASSRK